MAQCDATLKRYELKPEKQLGEWAIIVIDTARGFFSAVSDHGNYSYLWTHPGMEFRKFLVQCDLDYVYGKLTHAQRVFDPDASVEAAREALKEIREAQTREPDWIEREDEDLGSVSSESDFMLWQSNTEMEDPHEFYRTRKESECWGFCQKLFTRFKTMLREELEKEETDGAKAEEGSPAKEGK